MEVGSVKWEKARLYGYAASRAESLRLSVRLLEKQRLCLGAALCKRFIFMFADIDVIHTTS